RDITAARLEAECGAALRQRALPILYLPLSLVFSDAIAVLNSTDQLITLSFDARQIVIGQFPPLFLDRAFELLPIAGNTIPIHRSLLCRLIEPPTNKERVVPQFVPAGTLSNLARFISEASLPTVGGSDERHA